MALTVLSLVIGRQVAIVEERGQGEILHSLARAVANAFSTGLYERLHEIELLAATQDARRMAQSTPASPPLLAQALVGSTRYAWIGVADVQGTVRAANNGLLVGSNVKERPWFRSGMERSAAGDVHEAKLLAALLPASPNNTPLRLLDFAAPIRDERGEVVGVLGAHIDWNWARDVITAVRSEANHERGVQVFVLDPAGRVLHGPQELRLAPTVHVSHLIDGRAERLTWSDGGKYLTAAVRVPARAAGADLGWHVVVRQPEDVALVAAHSARDGVLWAGALVAVGMALLGWLVLKRITQPLEAIAATARRIEQGELHTPMPLGDNLDEVREVGQALQRMTHKLVEANQTLEAKVAQRTAELERVNAELEHLATRDALTGLHNRRVCDERLWQEILSHRRLSTPLAVLLMDIDHFKRINDSLGHAEGDTVLQDVAQRLLQECRRTDFVGRYGGEEFLILLPNTDAGGAELVARNLLHAVAARPIGQAGLVTISAGLFVDAAAADPDDVLQGADAALYAAKHAGRNRITRFQDAGPFTERRSEE
ncbi:sensor domain-containing diguanylate cyclase [Azohydromonas australica]|uniref:sensor domain-containing diguanylate cyclase n=1 Tax=Azohydromonas australica TaxID=364039 RepID=UPI0006883369|nr:sensor domain-containing diguanylate cyclase [Azohydromonas australica]